MINEQLSKADLSEMLAFSFYYSKMGSKKIQMDSEYAIEILTRLLEFENSKAAN